MKKFSMLIILLLISGSVEAREFLMGYPTSVTLTATTLYGTAITGSANSATAWTLLRGSNAGSVKWYISEPSNTYDLKYTYNPLTYTVVNDYGLIKKSADQTYRFVYLPDGVYVNVTFTTVYAGDTFSTTVYYEGQR